MTVIWTIVGTGVIAHEMATVFNKNKREIYGIFSFNVLWSKGNTINFWNTKFISGKTVVNSSVSFVKTPITIRTGCELNFRNCVIDYSLYNQDLIRINHFYTLDTVVCNYYDCDEKTNTNHDRFLCVIHNLYTPF